MHHNGTGAVTDSDLRSEPRPKSCEEDAPLPVRPLVYGVVGHAVLAKAGDTSSGRRRLAIWHVSAEGSLCGAWAHDWPSDADSAARVVPLLDRRLLVDTDPAAVTAALSELTGLLPEAAGGHLAARVTAPAELLRSVATGYAELQDLFSQAQASRPVRLVPLDLPDLPTMLVGSAAHQARALQTIVPTADRPPGVSRALTIARMVSRLIELWMTAEAVRARRSYLRRPVPQPLPQQWLEQLKTAAVTTLTH